MITTTSKPLRVSTPRPSHPPLPATNIIGFHPPEINKEELNLSRKQRTRLAQLQSGYCIITNYYKNIINEEDPISCPNCNSIRNVNHLFNCDENPTGLTPRAVAIFLNLENNDDEQDGAQQLPGG